MKRKLSFNSYAYLRQSLLYNICILLYTLVHNLFTLSLNIVTFPFKNFSCCNTFYAILDKASAIKYIIFAFDMPDVQIIFLQGQTPPHYPVVSDFCFPSCGFEGEGIVICEDKHWVYGGSQIYIKMLQCQNESKALLFNSGVISLVLVRLLGEVWNRVIYTILTNLHKNSTTPYVTGIYGQLELFLKVWCYQNWFTNQYGFDFVETIFGFLWPNIFGILCHKICQWTGHIRKILTKLPVISSHT